MGTRSNLEKLRNRKVGAIAMVLFFSPALLIHLGTTAAQQSSTGQSPAGAAPARGGGSRFHEPAPIDFDDHTGYVQLFDGTSMKGWDGDPSVWHVENGAIVGVHLKDTPINNGYITYRDFEAKDFDLKLEIKVEEGGGSGVQYRSKTGVAWLHPRPNLPAPNVNWMLTGPQADFWFPVGPQQASYTGQFYSENTSMGIVSYRGQVVEMVPGSDKRLVGNIGDRLPLGGYVKPNDWNQYLIMARGGTFIHILNGQLMAVLVDDDANDSNNQPGTVGIEIEGFPSKVSVRNIWMRKLQ